MKEMSAYKAPTQIIVIDDNKEYLEGLKLKLPQAKNTFVYFDDILEAEKYITNNEFYSPLQYLIKAQSDPNSSFEEWGVKLQIQDLQREIYNPKRFSQIACLIIDYDLCGSVGIDFCKKLNNKQIKKILLTGVAPEQKVIDAFNDGVIDKYINKSHPDIFTYLNDVITQQIDEYFIRKSSIIYEILSINNLSITKQPQFVVLMSNIISENKIVEYYMFESSGCYLMLNADAEVGALFVYSESDINEMADYAEEALGKEADITRLLKEKQKIFCYHSKSIPNFPSIEHREKYMQEAKCLETNLGKYYWSYTKNFLDVDIKQILSFNKYKQVSL